MKLARESHSKFEKFFREIFEDGQFQMPEIYIYAGRFSRILTFVLKIHGITIGRNIFITPKFVSLGENDLLKLHVELAAHEITHVLQYRRLGFIKFFYKYFRDFARNLRREGSLNAASRRQAYLEIPFEIEARETAARFVEWNGEKWKMKNG